MRLIDADDLYEKLQKDSSYDLDFFDSELREVIETFPTAYDVEKVVKQLEDMKLIRVEQCHGDYEIEVMTNNNFVDAIDIVKNGGK